MAVDLYCKSLNKAEAYRAAGYRDPNSYHKFFAQAKIQQEISKAMAVVGTAREALATAAIESLRDHLRANAFDVFTDDWDVRPKYDIPGETQHAAMKVTVKKYDGGRGLSVSVSIPSKLAVQKMALEYCNLIAPDKSEEPGPSLDVVASFDEKLRLMREKAAQARAALSVSPAPE